MKKCYLIPILLIILVFFNHHGMAKMGKINKTMAGEYKFKINMAELVKIAVRYYYPHWVKGRLVMHICVGINGLSDYPDKIDESVKNFCKNSIFKDIRGGKYKIHEDASRILSVARKLKFSSDKKVDIYRIQGALWFQLSQSRKLKKLLLEEYDQQRKNLPFLLTKN